jgi:HlyD family secretion protein
VKPARKKIPALLATAAVAALIVYSFLPRPIQIDIGSVKRGSLIVTVNEDGRTRVKERYVISAPLSGRMQRIALKAGDPVKARDTRITVIEPTDPELLDPRVRAETEARVQSATAAEKRAEANVAAAEADLKFAQVEFEREKALQDKGVTAARELDDAEHRRDVAAEALEAARFALQTARYEREQAEAAFVRSAPGTTADVNWLYEVSSPIDGKVLRVMKESAAVVTPGTELVEVGDPTKLEVAVDVLSSDAVRIRPGAHVFLDGWGGDYPLNARVRVVEPSAFTKISALGVEEQRVWVIADFTDPIERRPTLFDQYRVDARIVTWSGDNVLKVPAGALFRSGDAWAVFAVNGGHAKLRTIRVAHNNGLEAEVLDGLAEGDAVILHPGDRIDDGSRVEVRQ